MLTVGVLQRLKRRSHGRFLQGFTKSHGRRLPTELQLFGQGNLPRKLSAIERTSCLAVRASVACSVTGVGELVMRAGLAREAARRAASGDADLDAACAAALEAGILQVGQQTAPPVEGGPTRHLQGTSVPWVLVL